MPEAILYSRFRLSPPGERPAATPAKTAERADASQTYDDPALAVLARGVDNAFYLNMYKDVADANIDPVLHYHKHGWRERRDPNIWFETHWYLENYHDVRRAEIDPFLHYLQYGRKEQRPFRSPYKYRRAVVYAAIPPSKRVVKSVVPPNAKV